MCMCVRINACGWQCSQAVGGEQVPQLPAGSWSGYLHHHPRLGSLAKQFPPLLHWFSPSEQTLCWLSPGMEYHMDGRSDLQNKYRWPPVEEDYSLSPKGVTTDDKAGTEEPGQCK
ncbi:hypothetical protein Y1Q_0003076 [Alligator mississippiensis]|uniref:Uncharacterized protein n=1 Tax=Alligator mississippiensis TaxID=8496 RepID=A0A151MDB5_ALLMI|nr:hypothetical protein Y1Q_0003076 [Alligator mississippiensis]